MSYRVCDAMTQDVVTFDPDMTLTELDRSLTESGVSGGPVVRDGRVVGVVSQADVVRALYREQVEASKVSGFYTSPFPIPIPALERLAQDSRKIADHMTHATVGEIMSPDVRSVAPDDLLEAVARRMAAEGIHRLPVIDDGDLIGIISSLDLVRVLGRVGLAEN